MSVQKLAYALWAARGRPLGDDWADWFAAEARLRADEKRTAPKATPAAHMRTTPPPLFNDDPSGDDGYRACRDHITKSDVRLAMESAWRRGA